MFKMFFKYVKRIMFNILFLYSYNLIIAPVGLIIPINIITVFSMTLLGIPALLGFIIISIIAF